MSKIYIDFVGTAPVETGVIDWGVGLSESVMLATIAFGFFSAYIFLGHPQVFANNFTVQFYTILLLIGIVTNIEGFQKIEISKKTFVNGTGYGVIGFLFLLIPGFLISITGFKLLTIPLEAPIYLLAFQRFYEYFSSQLSPIEQFAIQITFVAFGEELFYRNTIPKMMDELLRHLHISRQTSLIIAFIISMILFGSAHFFAYQGSATQLTTAFIAGGILAAIRYFARNEGGIWTTVVAHLLYNVIVSLGLFTIAAPGKLFTLYGF